MQRESYTSAHSSSHIALNKSSENTHTSTMAKSMVVQKMDSELHCPACSRYFLCPLLLPCGHSLCTSCAGGSLISSNEPQVSRIVQSNWNYIVQDLYSPNLGNPHSSASSSTSGCSVICTAPASTIMTVGNNHSFPATGLSSNSDSDQLSVLSETDSGVVVTSRPTSFSGRLPLLISFKPTQAPHPSLVAYGLFCPACNRIVGLLDDKGIAHLHRNRALEHLVHKFVDTIELQHKLIQSNSDKLSTHSILPLTDPLDRHGGPLCQLCEEPAANVSTVWCQQCEIFYCDPCREKCHPSRGPLLRHTLHSAIRGVELVKQKRDNNAARCPAHLEESMCSYCLDCSVAVCHSCFQNIGSSVHEMHEKHDVQHLNTLCKTKKTELSQALQSLSEKARSCTEFIQNMRAKSETINRTFSDSEQSISSQLDLLIKELENKKIELISQLRQTREKQQHGLKEKIAHLTSILTRSTGLIQFCIEMLKDTDPAAFLLVSSSLISRTIETEYLFVQESDHMSTMNATTETVLKGLTNCALSDIQAPKNESPQSMEPNSCHTFALHCASIDLLKKLINDLTLNEELGLKVGDSNCCLSSHEKSGVPAAPMFLSNECISERNLFTLVWRPTSKVEVDKYTLELDDGANGNFRKVYRGPQTICTVEGLHFRSTYRARVKAQNAAGESEYSPTICLQTSELTWFHLVGLSTQPEILLTNGNRTVTSQLAEDRVVLGSTGLSRGVHYWEFTVDRCDAGGQPAFGIARQDSNKQIMLGLDMRSWAVYFDQKRSWFLHNGEHFERTDGGVHAGSVVGIRFDADRGNLSFYLNDEPHGPIAFTNLPQTVYYPAISLTKSIQLTLHAGLEAPSESEESDEDSSGAGTGTETTSLAATVIRQSVASSTSFVTAFKP